ncbi:MAG: hypothetical protein PHV74_10770 [Dehalococcoidia bacterium]|nr:hypothetical protein [Dehalococcoidia bacterium]
MKGITDVAAGATRVKSARGGKLLSAPRTKNTSYLDLFSLQIERSRLNQEAVNLNKRRGQIEGKLAIIQKRLEEIREAMLLSARKITDEESKEAQASDEKPAASKPPSKNWRAMPMEY